MAFYTSDSVPKPSFVKINPDKSCIFYGTGECCNDKHFDPKEVLPAHEGPLCKTPVPRLGGLTTDKDRVNCQDCLELLHS